MKLSLLRKCWCPTLINPRNNFHRNFASQSSVNIFDQKVKKFQKKWASLQEDADAYDYLKIEMAKSILDRSADVKRYFPSVLDLGCNKGHISRLLCESDGLGFITQFDNSTNVLNHSYQSAVNTSVAGEIDHLPFKDNSFDLVLSNLSLHWENHLPEILKEVKRVLRPDGCFIGSLFGMDTLYELRCSFQLAETERDGGMSVRVSPMIQGHQLSSLLFNAGYSMITLDYDEIVVKYPSMFELMRDLQGMGENNAVMHRRPLNRDTVLAAASIYQAMYGDKEEGFIPASFQFLFLIGWKPDKSQPKPLKPGSVPKGFSTEKITEK